MGLDIIRRVWLRIQCRFALPCMYDVPWVTVLPPSSRPAPPTPPCSLVAVCFCLMYLGADRVSMCVCICVCVCVCVALLLYAVTPAFSPALLHTFAHWHTQPPTSILLLSFSLPQPGYVVSGATATTGRCRAGGTKRLQSALVPGRLDSTGTPQKIRPVSPIYWRCAPGRRWVSQQRYSFQPSAAGLCAY